MASETARWAVVDRNPYDPCLRRRARCSSMSSGARALEFEEREVCIGFPDPGNPGAPELR